MKNSDRWTVVDTGISKPQENMRIDKELLDELSPDSNMILHIYGWQGDCATYGHFVSPFDFLSEEGVLKRNLKLAKRPTGGGIIFHIWDLAFSVLVPSSSSHFSDNTLANYKFINNGVLSASKEFLKTTMDLEIIPEDFTPIDASCKRFCMAQPTKYDVVLGGKKIAGAAQRKTNKGFLHQGSISLMMPCPEYLSDVLLPHTHVLDAMMINTFPLMGNRQAREELLQAREIMQNLLIKHLTGEI
ncbi:MAG: hypothetical protein FJZ57_00260 [Chlamydiae bacterium]|nr:hypothetical protein [Chlamydiota bacterium]